jgi:hypothetical protein
MQLGPEVFLPLASLEEQYLDGHGLSIRALGLATIGWSPSRRKPQDLLYFSIDYFVINASLPR